MFRHEKVRTILKNLISKVDELDKKEFDDEKKRSLACDDIVRDLHNAYKIINELKKEFEEKI